jgi:Lon protease-like protein
VGTTATIAAVESLENDALHIMAVGQERFRLTGLLQSEPYLVGEVELLGEAPGVTAPRELYSELRELFGDYLHVILQLLGQPQAEMTVPDDPAKLSYMIAAHLTSPLAVRQRLLEMDSLPERLFHERLLLKQENSDYRLILSARERYDELMQPMGDRPDAGIFSVN